MDVFKIFSFIIMLLLFQSCNIDVIFGPDDNFPSSDELGHYSAKIDGNKWRPARTERGLWPPYRYSHQLDILHYILRDGKYERDGSVSGDEYTGEVCLEFFGYNDESDIDLVFEVLNVTGPGEYKPSNGRYDNRVSIGDNTSYKIIRDESFVNIEEIQIYTENIGGIYNPNLIIADSSYVKGTFELTFYSEINYRIYVKDGHFYMENKNYDFE